MEVQIAQSTVFGRVAAPASKSCAQRALALALLAEGRSVLSGVELCDDISAALEAVKALGATVEQRGGTLAVSGGLNPRTQRVDVGESGLAARILTPIAALSGKPLRIDGRGTLPARPMGPMIEALQRLGVGVASRNGRLPLDICGVLRGGETELDGSLSSQVVSGLLMALPLAKEDSILHVADAVSTPYIEMTLEMMSRFGVETERSGFDEFHIRGRQRYTPAEVKVEGDWSAAAMLLTAGATAGCVTVEGLNTSSLQADMAICKALAAAGAEITAGDTGATAAHRPLHAFRFDATHSPDLIPALAALAAAADGVSEIRGANRLLAKESDRAEALRREFGRLGIDISVCGDVMSVRGGEILGGCVDSHADHRIAMALSVAALRGREKVTVSGAECVAKSFPEFFSTLNKLRVK